MEERSMRKGKANVECVIFIFYFAFFFLKFHFGLFGGIWSTQFRGTVG